MIEIKPTERQHQFLSSEADIVIYGGSAGGGKTYALLLEPLRFTHVRGFDTVYFRRRRKDLTISGSAFPESQKIYPRYQAEPNLTMLRWTFPSGATIYFDGLGHDKDVENWATSQIACLIFDQLEQFTAHQFYGLTERLRTMCGVTPYVRAGCNPSPDSFLHNDGTGVGTGLISWWIDKEGWAIPERSGVIRWFMRVNEKLVWGDTPAELRENINKHKESQGYLPIRDSQFHPRSITFIMATVFDNKPLMEADPSYLAVLHNLPYVRRMRMMGEDKKGGNWNIRETAGNVFRRGWFLPCKELPGLGDDVTACRFWDIAASVPTPKNPNPDWLAGSRWHRKGDDYYWINTTKSRGEEGENTAGRVDNKIIDTAQADGHEVSVIIEGEPGSQSMLWAESIKKKLAKLGFHCVIVPSRKSKVQRAMPYSALAEHGHVYIPDPEEYDNLEWLEHALLQHENFPPASNSGKDDVVDTCSGAVGYLRDGGALEVFTDDDPHDVRNAVYANRAPKGTFRQDGSEGPPIDMYSPIDNDNDDRAGWEK